MCEHMKNAFKIIAKFFFASQMDGWTVGWMSSQQKMEFFIIVHFSPFSVQFSF